MIQKNLLGKEVKKKEKCSECGKFVDISELGIIEIYHPFDDIPSFSQENICRDCHDNILSHSDSLYCDGCGREIYENNGFRQNFRFNTEFPEPYEFVDAEVLCVSCCQDFWLEVGMSYFKDGDFFDDGDLVDNDFSKKYSYYCRTKKEYDNAKKDFVELREKGKAVIVSIEASGMGLEHFLTIWVK